MVSARPRGISSGTTRGGARKSTGHRWWTVHYTGDPVTGLSLEPEITESTRSLWPTRRIAASTPTTTTTRRARSRTEAFRHRGKDTDWQRRVLSPLIAAATFPTMQNVLNRDFYSRSV